MMIAVVYDWRGNKFENRLKRFRASLHTFTPTCIVIRKLILGANIIIWKIPTFSIQPRTLMLIKKKTLQTEYWIFGLISMRGRNETSSISLSFWFNYVFI